MTKLTGKKDQKKHKIVDTGDGHGGALTLIGEALEYVFNKPKQKEKDND